MLSLNGSAHVKPNPISGKAQNQGKKNVSPSLELDYARSHAHNANLFVSLLLWSKPTPTAASAGCWSWSDLSIAPPLRRQKGRGRWDRQPVGADPRTRCNLVGRPDARMSGNNTRRSFYRIRLSFGLLPLGRICFSFQPKTKRGLNGIHHGCIGAQLILTPLIHLLICSNLCGLCH